MNEVYLQIPSAALVCDMWRDNPSLIFTPPPHTHTNAYYNYESIQISIYRVFKKINLIKIVIENK